MEIASTDLQHSSISLCMSSTETDATYPTMSDLDIDIMVLELLRRKLVKFQRSGLVLRERSIALELLWDAHSHNSRTRSTEYAQLYIREQADITHDTEKSALDENSHFGRRGAIQ